MTIKLQSWDIAPDFCLPGVEKDCKEKQYCLKNLLEESKKGIILYFYPRDNTPWCTTEAKDFTTYKKQFENLGYNIIGISKDSINSHCKFIQKHDLTIPLLSDTTTEIMKQYWAWWEKKMYGKTTQGVIRSTFIIWKNGKILKSYYNVRAKGHVEKLLKEIEKL
jgi:peroxiredoxin Q/BCP